LEEKEGRGRTDTDRMVWRNERGERIVTVWAVMVSERGRGRVRKAKRERESEREGLARSGRARD